MTGPPAVGKTTVAALLAARRSPSVHLRADAFWGFVVGGYVDPWLAEARQQNETVARAVFAAAAELVAGGFHVVLDGVVGPWFLSELTTRCPPDRCELHYVILLPPLDRLLANLAGRTGHGFTSADAAAHMHRAFEAARGPYERHVLDPAALSPEETARAVEAAVASGRVRLLPSGRSGEPGA